MIQKGDALPFFDTTSVEGERVRYADLWQRRNVLLVCLPPGPAADEEYVRELSRRAPEFEQYTATCIVTHDRIPGIPSPGVAIADRWGEVQYLASSATIGELPEIGGLVDTLYYIHRRCPECEGEAR